MPPVLACVSKLTMSVFDLWTACPFVNLSLSFLFDHCLSLVALSSLSSLSSPSLAGSLTRWFADSLTCSFSHPLLPHCYSSQKRGGHKRWVQGTGAVVPSVAFPKPRSFRSESVRKEPKDVASAGVCLKADDASF